MVNKEIVEYIEKNILPSYDKNDKAHNKDHIKYVVDRSLKFASAIEGINYDMVYVIASYHDIGHYIDAKKHEEISAKMLLEDNNLKKWFTDEEIKIMSEAVYDHRSSLEYEPRSIYGKIVSSADRNTSVDLVLSRTHNYRLKHNPELTFDEMAEDARQFIKSKYGKNGYAVEKVFFEDEDYKKYLEEVDFLVNDKEEFIKRYKKVNK